MGQVTIVMVVRDAAATIERALKSALAQGDHPILLFDNGSRDGTAELARAVAGEALRIVSGGAPRPLGAARQAALNQVEMPFGVWLDGDDVLAPGRVARLYRLLAGQDADLVFDGAVLFDGASGRRLRDLPLPGALLAGPWAAWRLFERNPLPAPGVPGFRTEAARQIGYDPAFETAEDYDFILRMIQGGAAIGFCETPGYHIHAYPGSQSRDLARQNAWVRRALMKHPYEAVRQGLGEELHPAARAWALYGMALGRGDLPAAQEFLDEIADLALPPGQVLERDWLYPLAEGWRLDFARGSLALLHGDGGAALGPLRRAVGQSPRADALNNLGLALRLKGDDSGAREAFARALELLPGYQDAQRNLKNSAAVCITRQPLRSLPSRQDYSPDRP